MWLRLHGVPKENGDIDLSAFAADTFWSALQTLMREARARVHENRWLVGFTRLMYDPPESISVREALAEKFEGARQWQAQLIRRGQEVGAVRVDMPAELLQALLVGADEAGDRWFVDNWDHLEESEIERLFEEVFAIFRRMLESPRAG